MPKHQISTTIDSNGWIQVPLAANSLAVHIAVQNNAPEEFSYGAVEKVIHSLEVHLTVGKIIHSAGIIMHCTLSHLGTLLLYPVAKITASKSSHRPSSNWAPVAVRHSTPGLT